MEDVSRSWGWAFFFGLLTLVVGILVMVWPSETLKVLAVLLGLQLMVMGIYRVIRSFAVGEQHRVLSLILGILSVVLGIVALRNVTETVAVLAVIMGIYWIVIGLVDFVVAIGDSTYPQRGFTIFLGLLSVAAGIVVVAWPVESVSVLAWLLGIWLAILGALGIVMSIMMATEAKALRAA